MYRDGDSGGEDGGSGVGEGWNGMTCRLGPIARRLRIYSDTMPTKPGRKHDYDQ